MRKHIKIFLVMLIVALTVVSGCQKSNDTTQTTMQTEQTESGVEFPTIGRGEIENGSDFINKAIGCKLTFAGENWEYINTVRAYPRTEFKNTEQDPDCVVGICSSLNSEISKDEFEKEWKETPTLTNNENYEEREVIIGKSTEKQYKGLEYSYKDTKFDLYYTSVMFYADDEVYIMAMQSDEEGLEEISKTYEAVKDTFEVYK